MKAYVWCEEVIEKEEFGYIVEDLFEDSFCVRLYEEEIEDSPAGLPRKQELAEMVRQRLYED